MAKRPPPGYERAGQKSALARMTRLLNQAAETLREREGLESRVYIHVNRDDSIDGELKVAGVRGSSTDDLFIGKGGASKGIEGAFPTVNLRGGIWLSVGTRFSYQNEEDPYSRYKGLSQVQSHYRRYSEQRKPLAFIAARTISSNLEKKTRRKIDHVFVRLNWNPDNMQPQRGKRRKRPKPK
jgi:hypothetical protein